jgi:hypothetical protein
MSVSRYSHRSWIGNFVVRTVFVKLRISGIGSWSAGYTPAPAFRNQLKKKRARREVEVKRGNDEAIKINSDYMVLDRHTHNTFTGITIIF